MARLLTLLRFRAHLIRLAFRMAPIAGGAEDADGGEESAETDGGKEETAEKDAADADESKVGDSEADAEDGADDAGEASASVDWRRMARKHEREAKKARTERDKLQASLKSREDADRSEQEKAIEQAEQTARTEERASFDKERRQDRLEVAATKLAAKGLKIGEGDKAKTVRFADPDDALLHLERDIRTGDLDGEDIFTEEGKVKADALQEALADLLSRKPHLAADSKPAKVQGGADGGKGTAPSEADSVDAHFKQIRRHTQGGQAPQYEVGRRS